MINKIRGGLKPGEDYYHIVVSNYYHDPNEKLGDYFEKIEPIDTVAVVRGGAIMRYVFFYRLKNYRNKTGNPICLCIYLVL